MEISEDKMTTILDDKVYDFVYMEKSGNCRSCYGCDITCARCEIPKDQCKGGVVMECVEREDNSCGYWKEESIFQRVFKKSKIRWQSKRK